jgi:hypothetical protein
MNRLRSAAVLAAVLATTGSVFSASPAAAADQAAAACDPALAPGLTWSAPSSLAWGREVRVGADVADSADGPIYADGSVALAAAAGSTKEAGTPVDHDFEFVVKAPTGGAALNLTATWTMVDETGAVRCNQTAALTIPLARGGMLRYRAKPERNGVTWVASGGGDCHDIALQPISLTVAQGGVTRHLNAGDQCNPAGAKPAGTADWQLALAGGHFVLRAVAAHSSLTTRLRYALRVGPRRVASGSLSLTRVYRPVRLIVVSDPAFQSFCVHGIYPMKWYGATIGCKIPGAMSVRLKLA